MFTPDRARLLGGISAGLGLILVAYGLLALVSSSGSSGLGALLGFALAVGLFILGGVPLLLGVLSWRASIVLQRGEEARPVSGMPLLAAVAGLIWALPAMGALLVSVSVGAWALPDGTGVVAVLALVIGVLLALGALLARTIPLSAVGFAIRALVVASLVIPAWETSVIAPSLNPPAQLRAEHERAEALRRAQEGARTSFDARYASILSGPAIPKLVVTADRVGTWRVVNAGLGPTRESCGSSSGCSGASARSIPSWERIGELAGRRVRFLIVGQCWVEGDPGSLRARILSRTPGWPMVEVVAGPCDGRLRMASSGGVLLPLWTSDQIAAMADPQRAPLIAGASAFWARTGMPAERAERWVLLISPEPVSDPAAVLDALRAVAPDLQIN